MSVIESVSQNGGSQLSSYSSSSKCINPSMYNLPPNRFCGYAQTQCTNRFGCVWTNNGKCKPVVNCDYPTKTFCEMDSIRCSYSNGNCVSNSICGTYLTKPECKGVDLCKWKKGVCIAK